MAEATAEAAVKPWDTTARAQEVKRAKAMYEKNSIKKTTFEKSMYADSDKVKWFRIDLYANGVRKSRVQCILKRVENEDTGRRTWKIVRGKMPPGEKLN